MKKKIVGIFVCMLMIAAAVLPAAGTINEKAIKENEILRIKPTWSLSLESSLLN